MINSFVNSIKGDKGIWFVIITLYLFSILMVYSTSSKLAFQNKGSSTEGILLSQILYVALGLVLLYHFHKINYNRYAGIAIMLFLISIPLLAYTMIWGNEINGARRWLTIPLINKSFQTSDLGKLGLVMYLSYMLSVKRALVSVNFKNMMVYLGFPILIIAGLIAPWNMSTACLVFGMGVLMLFIAKISTSHIWQFILFSMVLFALFIGTLKLAGTKVSRLATWENRIESFVQSAFSNKPSNSVDENTLQVSQAKVAIAQGGLFGVGPGNSRAKHFLFSAHADLIYPIIIEEHGLIRGGLFILVLYMFLLYRCIAIFKMSAGPFGSLLALGLGLLLVLQALLNMAVSVNLVPVTGVALPLVSKGGTSLLFTSIALGIILSVSVHIEANTRKNEDVKLSVEV